VASPASPQVRASEAVARFVVAPPAGVGFDAARRAARTSLLTARAALHVPSKNSASASRALASYGAPLRRAFGAGTSLAGVSEDAAIVAAAVATSELSARGHADADDVIVIEAIAIGREIARQLARTITFDAPWDAAAVVAGIGAAAAAAHAAALDEDATRHALGLAATQAAGLGAIKGTPAAAFACGKAAADAVEAALLAHNGFTAASSSLEGRRGLAALMASHFDEAALCEDLGRRWFSADG